MIATLLAKVDQIAFNTRRSIWGRVVDPITHETYGAMEPIHQVRTTVLAEGYQVLRTVAQFADLLRFELEVAGCTKWISTREMAELDRWGDLPIDGNQGPSEWSNARP